MSFDLRRQRQTLFGQSTDFLIGELLLKAGVIKQHQLDDALKLAGNKHMQIGQMLIMARYITQRDLQAAIDAQIALRDRILDMNTALKALTMAYRNKITFAEASQRQSQETSLLPNHKLGQILLEGNFINPEQLSLAVQKSMATGLPVGRILILNNVITEKILAAALEVLIKMRDGNIAQEEAIAYISHLINTKAVDEIGVAGLEEASVLGSQPVLSTRKNMRLGEFLVLSGILSETDVMNALEFSLVSEKRLGEALLEHGYINREIMDSTLKLQSLMDSDTLDPDKAAKCLSMTHTEGISLTEALEKVTSMRQDGSQLEFRTLLVDSHLVGQEDIKTAIDLAASNPPTLAQILTQTGYLTTAQADILLECHEAITKNLITQHDAEFVLDFCLQKLADGSITFSEGLQELGWTRNDESQPQPKANNFEQPKSNVSQEKNPRFSNQNMINSGAFIGNVSPSVNDQSFTNKPYASPALDKPYASPALDKPNASPASDKPNASPALDKPNASPASDKPSVSPASESPKLPTIKKHTGRTTSNMPAITNLQAGSELHPVAPENDSSQTNSSMNQVPGEQTHSLKSLLKDQGSDYDIGVTAKSSNNGNYDTKTSANIEENTNSDGLALSESEKALIMKASSLTASPREIMEAMKLAAQKDKTIQSQDKGKEEEGKGK